jgi:hypothetical protein
MNYPTLPPGIAIATVTHNRLASGNQKQQGAFSKMKAEDLLN